MAVNLNSCLTGTFSDFKKSEKAERMLFNDLSALLLSLEEFAEQYIVCNFVKVGSICECKVAKPQKDKLQHSTSITTVHFELKSNKGLVFTKSHWSNFTESHWRLASLMALFYAW